MSYLTPVDKMKAINKGFVKLPRTYMDWQWYDDVNTSALMTHLLLKANFKRKEWRGVVIRPNELITSFEKLAIETGLSISKVRTAIRKLEKTKDIKTFPTNKFTKIQITASFFLDMQNDKQLDFGQQADNKLIATTKNAKETIKTIKEFKEEVFSLSQYSNKILKAFFNYWTEKNNLTGKLRFQNEGFWETEKRLAKWAENEKSHSKAEKDIILDKNR